jgi:hypothetical protein
METVRYQLTVADLVNARNSAYKSLPFVKAVRLVPFILVFGSLLPGAYFSFRQDWDRVASAGGWFVAGLVLIIWMYVGNRLFLPASVRKQLARNKALQGDYVVSWDAERIVFEASHGQSRWPWGDLYRWQESSGVLLLWQSDRSYLPLPKRALTDNQLSEIRAYLTNALGRPGKRRK